ncbi:NACHT domain-containing protein [Agrobacterium salinitolerans]|uniref:NACHT domain-containing protein n=1 Tax=Agrobacterium salinitolerans TaxID=1183413 RepID=UPI0022B81AC8|nr:NACHT domain-containing protein [Agrobacterium salinitolerans]MCZ7888667.1 NACHT domain-containing protein [Agrobacterium salinitolerans]
MNEVLDVNKVASATLTSLISKAFTSVGSKTTSVFRDAWTKIFEDFEPFMKDAHQKNAFVRLLSQKDKDVELYSVYVKSSFICGDKQFDDDQLIFSINEGRNVVINGNGGAGKTFFMRHLWLTLFKNSGDLTPIFIELRKLNDLTSVDLKSFIRLTISRKKELDNDLFSHFCNAGRFCFILDGFDEIIQSQRDSAQRQILELSSEYPDCRFVVSSRYERRFAGWQNFDLYESQPFDLAKVRKLVERVPFDAAAKKLFSKQLDEDFYKQNKSFLSNPLLAIMMLMTFKENMDIPRRMNIFYDQAFTTLFQWHDATKAFNREKTLDIDEFQRSFGIFCLLSYHQEKFEFTKSEVIDLIVKSSKFCGITKKPEDILKDYEETVNLLKQEGLKYIFIHRSFQEYFCAYALMRINPGKFADIFSAIRQRYDDNVLFMCFEMNRGIVLDEYVKPLFSKLRDGGLFKSEPQNKFNLLHKMRVTYSVRGRANPKDPENGLVALMYTMDSDVEELLNNVSRLMGYKTNGMRYAGSVMYRSNVFQIMDEVVRTIKQPCSIGCDLRFEADDVGIDVSIDPDVEHVKRPDPVILASAVKTGIQKRVLKFVSLEAKIAEELEKIRKWCVTELDQNQKREKSLDSILGI